MKKLVIGEAPGPRGMKNMIEVLYRKTGVLLRRAEHRNLLHTWPGPDRDSGKGSAFPLRHAQARARRFRVAKNVDTVLVLGKRVARAFGLEVGYFEFVERNGRLWAVIPHPSGVNHWWNDVGNRVRAMEFLEEL